MTDYQLNRLRLRHAALQAAIDHEMGQPLSDIVRLNALKKERLTVKDQIWAALRTHEPLTA